MSRLRDLFRRRGFWVVAGFAALAALVWWVGPLVAIAEWRPLESVTARVAVIAAILAVWLLLALLRWWRAKDLNAKLLGQLAQARVASAQEKTGTEEIAELRRRFEAAVEVLKKSRPSGEKKGWFGGRRQHIYQLPWYMFIGAPGSGKTTALINSGLEFPLADQFGKVAIRGIGGTRNCDWWFTNEAVLLDTAGRYTTQESNEAVDRAEWDGFLKLLKRYRPRQPINGVLLTLSVADLLALTHAERDMHSAVLKKRLGELRESLGIQFPVYVVVTKSDLLAGFSEYFASLNREQRAQVWGFTLPYDPAGTAGADFAARFRVEFKLLVDRLNAGLPELLIGERDPMRRALIYALPQQFAGLQEVIEQLLSPLLVQSRFGDVPMVRGVYFTSGTQEGTPFDRVLGALGRHFRLPTGVARGGPLGEGKSYFLRDLLLKVIIGEEHLAGRDIVWERRRAMLRVAGYAVTGVAFAVAVGGLLLSYANNRRYVDDVASRVQAFAAALPAAARNLGDAIGPVLPILDEARALPLPSGFPIDAPPLSYRFFLYQGYKIEGAASLAYRRLLEDGLLPRVARRVETLLREAPGDNLQLQYEALKRYLMLQDPERFDAEAVRDWMLADWDRNLGRDAPKELGESLARHLDALFAGRAVASPFARDDALVADARQRLAQYTPAKRIYDRLKGRLLRMDFPEFTVAQAGGSHAASVFVRDSGAPLTRGVPGLFTYRGYHEGFNREVGAIANLVGSEESWVLRDAPDKQRDKSDDQVRDAVSSARRKLDEVAGTRMTNEIRRLYYDDYVRQWEALLNDLNLVRARTLRESVDLAQVLSGPDSPLSLLVRAVARETTLGRLEGSSAPSSSSLLQRSKDAIRATKDDLERVFGASNIPGAGQQIEGPEQFVDRRFESFRRLAGSGSSADGVTPLVQEIYTALAATEAAQQRGVAMPPTDALTRARTEAVRLPQPLRRMVESLAGAGSAQAAGATRAAMGGGASAVVGDSCRKALEGRYPFDRASSRDVLVDDFARLFAPGGMFDDYFQKNLAQHVDITTNPWTLKPGLGAPAGSAGWLSSFQRAAVIRDVFFRGGARSPSMRVDIRPLDLDAAFSQMTLDIGGQVVTHTPGAQGSPQPVTFPGPKGEQVKLQLTPAKEGKPFVVTTEGPWALHRFLDRMQVAGGSSPERLIASTSVDGRRVSFEIKAATVQNPLRLRQFEEFRCPSIR